MPIYYEYVKGHQSESIIFDIDESSHSSAGGTFGTHICDFLSVDIKELMKNGTTTQNCFFWIPIIKEEFLKDSKAFVTTVGKFIVFMKMCDRSRGFDGVTLDSFLLFLHMTNMDIPRNNYNFPDMPKDFDFMQSALSNVMWATLLRDNRIAADKYVCNGIQDLCVASIYTILKNGFTIKKCGNCGKYFVPLGRSDSVYCDRHSPQDDTLSCKEYGTKKLWYDRMKNSESAKLYRNVYQSKQMLSRRHSKENDPILYEVYLSSFEKFKEQSAQWKEDVKSGIKTEEEFIEWLKAIKEKKVL